VDKRKRAGNLALALTVSYNKPVANGRAARLFATALRCAEGREVLEYTFDALGNSLYLDAINWQIL
jgi:hypothetical protein